MAGSPALLPRRLDRRLDPPPSRRGCWSSALDGDGGLELAPATSTGAAGATSTSAARAISLAAFLEAEDGAAPPPRPRVAGARHKKMPAQGEHFSAFSARSFTYGSNPFVVVRLIVPLPSRSGRKRTRIWRWIWGRRRGGRQPSGADLFQCPALLCLYFSGVICTSV
nr:uncharacterized protein LOC127347030 [Lolium perenne]